MPSWGECKISQSPWVFHDEILCQDQNKVRLCGIWTGVDFVMLHSNCGPSGKIRRMMYELQNDVDGGLKTSSRSDFWPTSTAPTLAWPMFSLRGPQTFLLKSRTHTNRTWRFRPTRHAKPYLRLSMMSASICRAAHAVLGVLFVRSKMLTA